MKFKRWIAALLTVWMLCPLPETAWANEAPDFTEKGKITVEMTFNEQSVTGGSLSAYYVGKIQETDGNYSFVPSDEMGTFPESYDDITDSKLAEKIAAFVKEEKLSPRATAENKNGEVVFNNLELGLYLIVQDKASKGVKPITPFLVSMPMNEDGEYKYEVNAEGKFELKEAPTTPPETTKPGDPDSKLPQTGQLNWPIPVLAVIGLLLFSAGWMLRFGKGKGTDEK